jgi:Mn2+/Fe2+ NRAMP family transporter
MSEETLQEADKQAIRAAREKGGMTKVLTYFRFSGPGWLQGAITLGGGSLAGSLYLGVLGGFSLLWLQPIAMVMGIIMLSAISYVVLSTQQRPLGLINTHINPVLGWGWAIATLMANIVWCLPQFALGTAAVQQNLMPGLSGDGGKVVIVIALLAASTVVIWFYDSGGKGIKRFELILKVMVAVVVVSFFGVVLKMSFSGAGLAWGEILKGMLIPNFNLLSQPAPSFDAALAATGSFADFWSSKIVADQRDVMITAGATAVGINMTFLLPYSMLKKKWDKEFRGLAIFDLATGLFIPFVLATTCVVIAAASQFHATPQAGVLEGTAPAGLMGQYDGLLKSRLTASTSPEAVDAMSADQLKAATSALPVGDKEMAAMLVKRDAFNLAGSLEKLTGKGVAQYVFGIGVLGMALSTIIILMLISGFTVCEMLNLPPTGWPHRAGCFVAGLGVLGPFVWSGKTQFWLAVPTSIFGMALLPIAYLAFFLLMNNKAVLGKDLPQGGKRIFWNVLMLAALSIATFGAAWAIWSKIQWTGVYLVGAIVLLAVIVHFTRRKPQIH